MTKLRRAIAVMAFALAVSRTGAATQEPPGVPQYSVDPYWPQPLPNNGLVHSVRIASDGLVYVCDRANNRIVFQKSGAFVKEVFIAKDTLGSGSVWDVAFSPDRPQRFLIVPDGTNQRVYILDRESLKLVDTSAPRAGQFYGAHNIASNTRGDPFITETYEGKRIQKFQLRVGTR